MTKPLTIIAIFESQPGREDELARILQSVIAPTRSEAGCLNYDLHRDHEVPGRFLFYENWATRPAWEAHMVTDHLLRLKEITAPLVSKLEIFQMEPTGD